MVILSAPNVHILTVNDLNTVTQTMLRKQQQLFKKALLSRKINAVTKVYLKEMISMIDNKFNAERLEKRNNYLDHCLRN